MSWLALDIGGANLKAADGRGWARSVSFALWREPEHLGHALGELVASAPDCDGLAVTMTGELCDCYSTKAEGVGRILEAAEQAAHGRPLKVYFLDGRLVPADEARRTPQLAAASNWQVLARFACRFTESGNALLVDVGSTTTDIVPLVGGYPKPQGLDDTQRLLAGELVYTGVGRTPICAIVRSLPWRDRQCPVAAELFATSADAYVILGDIDEQPEDADTADQRPKTRPFARARLARMICADPTTFNEDDAAIAAAHVRDEQVTQLKSALAQVAGFMGSEPEAVLISGAGEFLASRACRQLWPNTRQVSLTAKIGQEASRCAPAFALAVIANEAR